MNASWGLIIVLEICLIKVRNDVTNQQVKNAVSYGVRVKFCLPLNKIEYIYNIYSLYFEMKEKNYYFERSANFK